MKSYGKKSNKSRIRITNAMTMLNPDTAGIDIGSEFHWSCVPATHTEKKCSKIWSLYWRIEKNVPVV